ncbi:hypothetical protein ACKKBF_B04660 [Auxenochlorella protothecoides x Auxenochlorella symbiontica]
MGEKGKGNPPRVNPKKFTVKSGQCFEELGAYLACIASSGGETDERCAPARRAMMLCAATSANKNKGLSSVNYHLQRISRLMR